MEVSTDTKFRRFNTSGYFVSRRTPKRANDCEGAEKTNPVCPPAARLELFSTGCRELEENLRQLRSLAPFSRRERKQASQMLGNRLCYRQANGYALLILKIDKHLAYMD
jgi:hypothetical protein